MTALEAGLEAVLFAAGDAVTIERLSAALEAAPAELLDAAAALENRYDFENRGIMLLRIEDKLQLASRPMYGPYVRRVTESRRPPALSPAALEVLASRKVVQGANWVKGLKGTPDIGPAAEKGKSTYAGPEIAGKKLGIIGLGAIGVKVANAAVGLDMEVWGYDPYLSVDGALKLDRSVKHVTELDEIFANCDYITIHVPLNADTKNTISAEAIEKMKDGVRVINLARGELVDTKAMAKALESGKVAAYVSDFASDEILEQENAITLPHLGASTPESEDNCAKMAVYEITEYLEKGTIRNSVNFPNLKVPYEGGYRICMIHKNIPNMIASITSAVRCNIENMGNRSKGDYAYTIIDTAEAPTEANLDELRAIEGMISVRTI